MIDRIFFIGMVIVLVVGGFLLVRSGLFLTYPLQGVWHGKATSESCHRQSRKDVEVELRLEELPLAVYP